MAQCHIPLEPDEFSCPLCQNLLLNPVTIPCGHSYCMGCITNWWDRDGPPAVHSCPQCRKHFAARPLLSGNVMLAEMVQKIRGKKCRATKAHQAHRASSRTRASPRQHSPSKQKRRKTDFGGAQCDTSCPEHGKPLEVYCRTDASSICLLCVIDTHEDHDTVSVVAERRAQQKKLEEKQRRSSAKLQERERALQELRLRVKSLRYSLQTAINNSEKMFTELIHSAERWRSGVEDLLRAQEKTAVSHAEGLMEQLEQELAEQRKADRELEQLSLVEDHVDFLKRWASLCTYPELGDLSDINLDPQFPCEMLKLTVSDLKQQLEKVCEMQMSCILQKVNEVLQTPELCVPEPSTRQEFLQYAFKLTLNPDTAHKNLLLSPEYQEVKRVRERQHYAPHPERFTFRSQVLCREGLSGSRFYWEVELKGSKAEVAVTYQKISRKGNSRAVSFGGNKESWSLECINGVYSFSHNYMSFKINAPYYPRVGVYLDHRMGILSFYSISDTDIMTLLHRCQVTFTEPLYAGFWIGEEVTVKLCTGNLSQ